MAYAGTHAQQVRWADQLQASAGYAHIDGNVLWGVYGMETNFGRFIDTSSAGATGLMQFIPSTAALYNYPQTNYPDDAQAQSQFTAAALYLRDLYHQYGDWEAALRGYSAGGYGYADVIAKAGSFAVPEDGGGGPSADGYVALGPTVSGITRVDDGIDMTLTEAAVAIGNGRVFWRDDTQWAPWGAFMTLSLDDGSHAGWSYYVAEGILPVVHIGDTVKAGDVIAQRVANGGNGIIGNIEAGWAGFRNPTQTLAQERGHGGQVPSPEGEDFKAFYLTLGTSTAVTPPPPVSSNDLFALITQYDWGNDIENTLHNFDALATDGYAWSQAARREILTLSLFDTTGGR